MTTPELVFVVLDAGLWLAVLFLTGWRYDRYGWAAFGVMIVPIVLRSVPGRPGFLIALIVAFPVLLGLVWKAYGDRRRPEG